jgi:hypothetical protein
MLYCKQISRFIFVNYSGSASASLQPFHGKAVALDIQHEYAPFPSLFIIHEMRVRGFHPFQPTETMMSDDITWQDWISSYLYDNTSDSFICNGISNNHTHNTGSSLQQPHIQLTMSAGGGGHVLALDADAIADTLAATHAMPSWKACQVEGTHWTGTTKENIQKYCAIL